MPHVRYRPLCAMQDVHSFLWFLLLVLLLLSSLSLLLLLLLLLSWTKSLTRGNVGGGGVDATCEV